METRTRPGGLFCLRSSTLPSKVRGGEKSREETEYNEHLVRVPMAGRTSLEVNDNKENKRNARIVRKSGIICLGVGIVTSGPHSHTPGRDWQDRCEEG